MNPAELLALLAQMPPEVGEAIVRVVQYTATSDDKVRTFFRALEAEAADFAAKEAARKVLG